MTKSFALCYNDDSIKIKSVPKFQVNLWEIRQNYLLMEVGFQVKINKNEFFKKKEFALILYSPFNVVDNSLHNAYHLLLRGNNIRLIFNEKYIGNESFDKDQAIDYSKLIKFRDTNLDFLLLNCKTVVDVKDKSKIHIEFQTDLVDPTKIPDFFDFYVRMIYNIDLKKCGNINRKYGVANDTIHYDFRLNELRLFDGKTIHEIYEKILPVEEFYLFIINEINYKLRIADETGLRYERSLEKELFKSYIKELNVTTKKYLVHYWKLNPSKDSYNMIAAFEKEKPTTIAIMIAIFTNIVAAFFYSIVEIKELLTNFSFSKIWQYINIHNESIIYILIIILVPTLFKKFLNFIFKEYFNYIGVKDRGEK